MLDEWYSRSVSTVATTEDDDDEQEDNLKYKSRYKNLKRKLKYLIYENECFQDALRSAQRRLLIVSKDRSFLLDRLLQYEKVEASSSESEDTESSDDPEQAKIEVKKRKIEPSVSYNNGTQMSSSGKVPPVKKKRNPAPRPPKHPPTRSPIQMQTISTLSTNLISDGHMTPEEVERHLQSRQSYMELVPEKAPPTVPTEMFSNDPSLDSESNDIGELETSPSNMGEDLSIDMIAE